MSPFRLFAAAALAAVAFAASSAKAETLQLASPQPDPATLKPGLYVKYAYPPDIRNLAQAESYRSKGGRVGEPLIGFDYPDTKMGEEMLTSGAAERVIAFIDGYIHFEQPGTYTLQFWSNDGLLVHIGEEHVYKHDGRHTCDTLGPDKFTVPEAGYYRVETLFFQRLNTTCLLMKWQPPGGDLVWAPTSIYFHAPR